MFPFLDAGCGPPLLFLHGAPGDARTWAEHIALLPGRWRCLAYTQRWFGGLPWTGPAFGTATHTADLIAFLRALELPPVRLVAWSYSAHVAFQAAVEAPELFDRILVFEPGVPTYVTDPAELEAWGADAGAMFPPIQEALAAGDLEEAVRRLIDLSGGRGAFDAQPAERRALHLASASTMPLLFGGGEPPAAIAAGQLASLAVPVTVAWGRASRPVFTIPSRAAARAIGGGAHREIAGATHLWPEQEPAAFSALVAAWAA